MNPVVFTLYVREYCCLCHTMQADLLALQSSYPYPFRVQVVDIDDDTALEAQYQTLIPVLCAPNGQILCFYHLKLQALDAYFAQIR